jgi:putative glutathione S-transferase
MTTFASPIDTFVHGVHTPRTAQAPGRFVQRLGSASHPAVSGRYHLYVNPARGAAHRALIVRALAGLAEVVSASSVDPLRDGRGWAFRAATGPDPINGFALLADAYEQTSPGYDGPVNVPVLWDTHTRRIVSDNADTIDVDLATAFGDRLGLYREHQRGEIADVHARLGEAVRRDLGPSAYDLRARTRLLAAFDSADERLTGRRYLLGDRLTLSDVRLWVSLVRYDAGPNAHGAVGPKLDAWPHLWRYARDLHGNPAFGSTTRFADFAAPFATLPDWGTPR